MNPESLLEIHDLRVHYPAPRESLGGRQAWVKAVDGVSLALAPRETLGLVGESGCGKTTLGRAVVRLVEPTGGVIRFRGRDVTTLRAGALLGFRKGVQMIFQDPAGSLNPRLTVGESIAEPLVIHKLTHSVLDRKRRVAELLSTVGLPPGHMGRYPHEFSGGQRQRIGLARALAVEPDLIVCDEPVSALDVSVQAHVINLLQDLQRDRGLAFLFIAHDLAVVGHLSRRVAVMYLGRIVELGEARQLLSAPRHPYTQALLSAVPEIGPSRQRRRLGLKGEAPSPINPPGGCAFHPRCPLAEARCQRTRPDLRTVAPNQQVACLLAE